MAAYVVMVLAFLLNSRVHIQDLLKRTFLESATSTTIDDSDEVLPYRWAVLGTIFSFLLVVGLCVYAGMSFWVACSIIALFLIASTALSWMVVNGGMLLIQAPMYPVEYFEIVAGSRIINANSLALLGFQRVMMRDWGGILMPSVLHGFKAADPFRLNRRSILGAMALAIIVAIVVSYAASLPLIYEKGGLNMQHGSLRRVTEIFQSYRFTHSVSKRPEIGRSIQHAFGGRHYRLSTRYAASIYVVAASSDWVCDGCGLFVVFSLVLYVYRLVLEVFGTEIRRHRLLSEVSTVVYGVYYW